MTPANHGILTVNSGEKKNKWGAKNFHRSSIHQLKPTACHRTPTHKCKRLWIDFRHFILLILYSKHTNKNSGVFMLFKTIEKHIIVTKRRREMYIMYTTHFYIKQWQFFPLNVTEIPKTACVLLSKHLQYISIHIIPKQINKLTINLFLHIWHIQ